LSANLAAQEADTLLLFHLDRDRLLVVAEEALKGSGERFVLFTVGSAFAYEKPLGQSQYLLLPSRLLGRLLALALIYC
jgi:hypothetical protein